MTATKKGSRQISAKAVVNNLKIDSLPSLVFGQTSEDVIPYGQDNLYPQRIFATISKSPTAGGCTKRLREFVFGLGIKTGGDQVVNRDGESLNDVLMQSVKNYADFNGFALHFNFNIFGKICEIYSADMRFIRKNKKMDKAVFGLWDMSTNFFTSSNSVEVDLYDPDKIRELILKTNKPAIDYKGQLLYWTGDSQIYPTSVLDSASISASYEKEAQIYPYANIKNGFSQNTLIKVPTMQTGEESQEEINAMTEEELASYKPVQSATSKIEQQLQNMHGADKAGGSVVVEMPVGITGEAKDFKMVETLTPANVDSLFVNQNKKAEGDVLKVFTMPKILLGVSDNGMFNQQSFNDAFNYKNADTEGERRKIERAFNAFLPRSVFSINEIEIEPLKMKGDTVSVNVNKNV